ncbi:MAG: Lactoylglutathione lyase-related protein [Thermoleophilia bacterium]|nr:Lactoylglutathione lyase-related protein [Thermoleophilia bacterium]
MTNVVEVAIFTDDVAAAATFYRGLLGAEPVAEWPGGAIFAAGDSKLLVHERGAAMENGPPNEDHFAFSVVDLDAACDELSAHGVPFLVEPREYPWGRSAYLRDPDGRLVELAEDPG